MTLNRTSSPSVSFLRASLLLMVVGEMAMLAPSPTFMINSQDAKGDLKMSASPPDFKITASPSTFILGAGSTFLSTLVLKSLFGFSGNVTLSTSVHPQVFPWPSLYSVTASLSSHSVFLSSDGTATTAILIDTATSTPTGYYEVWINGVSGGLTHQALLDVRVGPHFNMSISPSSITILADTTGSFAITLVSYANFTINATFQTKAYLPGPLIACPPRCPVYPVVSVNPTFVTLPLFGTAAVTLTISTTSSTTAGNYAITVFGGGCVCILPMFTVTANVAKANVANTSLIISGTTAVIAVTVLLLFIRRKRTPENPV